MSDTHRGRLISFRISEEEYADLQKLCCLHGNNVSETARLGLLSLLAHQQQRFAAEKTIKDLEIRTRAMFFEVRELLYRNGSDNAEAFSQNCPTPAAVAGPNPLNPEQFESGNSPHLKQ